MGKALDGHVGDREQGVESHAEVTRQRFAVVGFEVRLRRWQSRSHRVVHEVEATTAAGRGTASVAQRVQPLECSDARIEDASPALAFDVLRAITREARHDVDLVLGEEGGSVLLIRLFEDRQVAAIDHPASQRARAYDEVAKVGVHLGRSARQIERVDEGTALEEEEQPLDGRPIESFRPFRARLDVTMMAGEVAAQSQIHLKRRGMGSDDRRDSVVGERMLKIGLLDRDGSGSRHAHLPFFPETDSRPRTRRRGSEGRPGERSSAGPDRRAD